MSRADAGRARLPHQQEQCGLQLLLGLRAPPRAELLLRALRAGKGGLPGGSQGPMTKDSALVKPVAKGARGSRNQYWAHTPWPATRPGSGPTAM